MSIRVFIDGAAGTTGLEIADRLAGRSAFTLMALEGEARKDLKARKEALNTCDIAILCLPDEAAREAVALIEPGSKTRVIDASSAHRTTTGWTYGFPEIIGSSAVAEASRVSNPGCFPTGFLALIAPLIARGLLPADWPYSVHAASGYSGGGKALIARYEANPTLAFRAYGLAMGHKHLPEMQAHAGLRHSPVFSPSVVNAPRGMIVEIPLPLSAIPGAAPPEALRAALAEHYAASPVVTLAERDESELLISSTASPWDGMELFVFASADARQARLIARLDNLGKGASGAAVQNLNLMTGQPETEGLALTPPQ